jgi:tRNA (guanine-N(7)-)-methyltransferase
MQSETASYNSSLQITTVNPSFVSRARKLSKAKKDLIEVALPEYLFNKNKLLLLNKPVNFEIGAGMGEHVVHQALANKEQYFLVSEPYQNGVCSILRQIQTFQIDNIIIWPADVAQIINDIPDNFLNAIYILFPDPWPKTKHHKRRLIYSTNMKSLVEKLQIGKMLYFASDINDYKEAAEDCFSKLLSNMTEDSLKPYSSYIKTKYNAKAEKEGRDSYYLQFKKI